MGKKLRTLGVVVMLVLAGATGYLAFRYRQLHGQKADLIIQLGEVTKQLDAYKTDPNQAAQAEVQKYVDAVSKLYAVPKDETPSVATVKDKDKLKNQPFFAKAENGDITLIYSNAKIAVLYRPSTNQIINVSAVTIQQNQSSTPNTNP